jgi:hypothetical protein
VVVDVVAAVAGQASGAEAVAATADDYVVCCRGETGSILFWTTV